MLPYHYIYSLTLFGFSIGYLVTAALLLLISPKQTRQRGLYISSPPIIYTSSDYIVLLVKAAYLPHSTHTADSLVICSARGTKLRMFPKGLRWKVPSRAATMTIFPTLASLSHTSAISLKNCPSSIATTLNFKAVS